LLLYLYLFFFVCCDKSVGGFNIAAVVTIFSFLFSYLLLCLFCFFNSWLLFFIFVVIKIMKSEHEYRLENYRDGGVGTPGAGGGGARTIGGGTGGLRSVAPKSLRGGGGQPNVNNRSFNWENGSSSHSLRMAGGGAVVGGGGGGGGGASKQAIAMVTAEAVPVDDHEDEHVAAQAAAPVKKSSVFSRMLKGQK
jgi:hypothetical protein